MHKEKLKIGIYGLTGCGGNQLLILDCEDRLVEIFNAVVVESFLMAQSGNKEVKLNIAFIEGSVSTEKEIEEIKDIRSRAQSVVAIGICACLGGIQAMSTDPAEWNRHYQEIYGETANPENKPVQSRTIDAYIKVDYYLPGCPIDKQQFYHTFSRLIAGGTPELPRYPVCLECKWHENDCLLNKNVACLGPLTMAGCSAICPSCNLACVGCWGPLGDENRTAEFYLLQDKGFDKDMIARKMKNFSGTKLKL